MGEGGHVSWGECVSDRGHAWQGGACVAGGMCGRVACVVKGGCALGKGACMVKGGRVWQRGGICGEGACMAEGCAW